MSKPANAIRKILEQGILINVTGRSWSGQAQLHQTELGFTKGEIPKELINLGKKNLIPLDWRNRLKRPIQNARNHVSRYAFPFPISNAFFVPAEAIPKVVERLDECKKDFSKELGLFIREYERIRDNQIVQFRKELPDIYKRTVHGDFDEFVETFMSTLDRLYPPKDELRAKFDLVWQFFEVNLPDYKRRSGNFLVKQEEENRKLAAQYQREAQREINQFLNDVVITLRGETVKVCSYVTDKIKRGEAVTGKNLNALKSLIDRFETLNFVGDAPIKEQLDSLRANYLNGHDGQYFKDNSSATKSLQNALGVVMEAAQNISDVSSVTGNWKRRIKL